VPEAVEAVEKAFSSRWVVTLTWSSGAGVRAAVGWDYGLLVLGDGLVEAPRLTQGHVPEVQHAAFPAPTTEAATGCKTKLFPNTERALYRPCNGQGVG
jgi:hypothetical protein